MSEELLLERDGGVLTLRMNRPQALNAINAALLLALRRAFEAAARDREVRAVVLTGEGRAFSSGGDVKEMAERKEAGHTDLGADLREHYLPLVRAIRGCPKPVIAAVNGVAAGAGLSLALTCDLRIAADDARLTMAFVRIGLVPDAGGLFFLSRLCGFGKAMELALTGDTVDAAEALRIGLVNAVVPSDRLAAAARERARAFSAGPAETYALIKRGLERALSLDLEQALELEAQLQTLAGRTADHQQAVRAFLDKRQPAFGAGAATGQS
jgi:2-(1,2-epoxy-1,2-dihydrophenyl)acetyl-CoA isomerase